MDALAVTAILDGPSTPHFTDKAPLQSGGPNNLDGTEIDIFQGKINGEHTSSELLSPNHEEPPELNPGSRQQSNLGNTPNFKQAHEPLAAMLRKQLEGVFKFSGDQYSPMPEVHLSESADTKAESCNATTNLASAPSLSSTYQQILNDLVPPQQRGLMGSQKEQVYAWLAGIAAGGQVSAPTTKLSHNVMGSSEQPDSCMDSPNGIPDFEPSRHGRHIFSNENPNSPRQQFADSLTQAYLEEKLAWERKRSAMFPDVSKSNELTEINELSRRLADVAGRLEKQLAEKCADSTAQGVLETRKERDDDAREGPSGDLMESDDVPGGKE